MALEQRLKNSDTKFINGNRAPDIISETIKTTANRDRENDNLPIYISFDIEV